MQRKTLRLLEGVCKGRNGDGALLGEFLYWIFGVRFVSNALGNLFDLVRGLGGGTSCCVNECQKKVQGGGAHLHAASG